MKHIFILIFSVFLASNSFADLLSELKIPTAENYESGKFLCTEKYKELLVSQKGFYVSVPINYSRPEAGRTEIYGQFVFEFNPKKKTLLYFTGGPGQTSHWGLFRFDTEFNVILMDQRGIACSRPSTVEQYLSPEFYSSENVARDAEEIRRFLKLEQISVYGISYGTLPATIYASLFPNATRALILEGVVYSVEDKIWEAPHRRKLLQKMIKTLPKEVLAKLSTIVTDHGIPDVWFANIGRDELLQAFGVQNYREKLISLMDPAKFSDFLEMLKSYYQPTEVEPHVLFALNQIPYLMLSCQEMGLAEKAAITEDSFVNGQLVPKLESKTHLACAKIKASSRSPYQALRYPVQVPVTYFQGADDGATPAPQAIHHYKNVPRGLKQLLILRRGGHNPNLQLVNLEFPGQIQIFNLAVAGEKIPASLIEQFNSSQDEYSWAFTGSR